MKKFSKSIWNKTLPFLLPFIILLIGILVGYFILLPYLDFVNNFDRSITILISFFGLIFAIFQVILNIKIQQVRNKSQLRYTEYKEIVKILTSITELLNDNMIRKLEIRELISSLHHRNIEFNSFINLNENYLFDGIDKYKGAIEIRNELKKILTRSYQLQKEFEKLEKNGYLPENNSFGIIHKMNWHNEVLDYLKKFNLLKYEFLKEIQGYFK